ERGAFRLLRRTGRRRGGRLLWAWPDWRRFGSSLPVRRAGGHRPRLWQRTLAACCRDSRTPGIPAAAGRVRSLRRAVLPRQRRRADWRGAVGGAAGPPAAATRLRLGGGGRYRAELRARPRLVGNRSTASIVVTVSTWPR